MKWKVCIKHLYGWVVSWTRCLFHGTPFYLENVWQTIVIQTPVFDRHFLKKRMKWACHIKGKKKQYLLPMITFQLSRKIKIFKNVLSTTVSMTTSLQKSCDETGGDINKCDCFWWNINIWKSHITQWTFQMASTWC